MVWAAAVDPKHKINVSSCSLELDWRSCAGAGIWEAGRMVWAAAVDPRHKIITLAAIRLEAVHWCRHLGGRAHGVGSCRGPQAQDR